jgi:two-component system alkaline phosphatase synthesis response regulator PhoP
MMGAILCIDDDPLVLDVTRLALEREGYRVLTATGGAAAISVAREAKDEIAIILLDWGLLDTDCEALLAKLKEARPAARILVTSGSGSATAISTEARRHIADFIAKPYLPKELARLVRQALRRARRSAAA